MAVVFLGTSMCSTCAPLNPAYTAEELRFYLQDLGAQVVVVRVGDSRPVITIALDLRLTVVEVGSDRAQPAGHLRITVPHTADPVTRVAMPVDADIALILHTSGTTARPKIVPLSQANLVASARHIARHLTLASDDRCLNVMPLFHIHGLVGTLLSTMASGGSIVCTEGFDDHQFFEWTAQFDPSWYSAVPTIHQSVVENGAQYRLKAPGHRFRFVRSSSAALAPAIFHRLQELTGAPVVEAYGMTEASHQMASNPLPPGARKPGSVGISAGVDIAIMTEAGDLLAPGETGEIVIRGPGVFAGYENRPQANANSFCSGWFRTGDQGRIDDDGYLFISGRLKEIVNRAGEKISPREVDEALLEHPAVAQAVAFGRPHATLGEDLVAAVVLRVGAVANEAALRAFLFERLAAFKVPSVIAFVDAIPKGATGKVQRTSLHEKLHAQLGADFVEPRTDLERSIQAIFREVLGTEHPGIHDNFFAAGGDSLKAARAVSRINERHGLAWAAPVIFHHPTIATLAAAATAENTAGQVPAAPGTLPAQFINHALGLGHRLTSGALETQLQYWRAQLEGLEALKLPTDRPLPARMNHHGALERFVVPKSLVGSLKVLASRESATLFMLLLAAFQVLLMRYCGQRDLAVGVAVAGRPRAEHDGLIGCFVNTLVMRARLGDNPTFVEFLRQVRQTSLDAHDNQELPFDKLAAELRPQVDSNRNSLYRASFELRDPPAHHVDLPGLTARPVEPQSTAAQLDLSLTLTETDGGLSGEFVYATQLFDATTIQRLSGQFVTLLEGIAADPEQTVDRLPLLIEAERHQVLVDWNHTDVADFRGHCIHHLFEQQVERTPHSVAVVFEGRELTYAELNARANQCAHALRSLGVGAEVLVGVYAERSAEMVVALLAVLKAGGAYVPLDPSFPQQRLLHMLEDTQVAVVLVQPHLLDELPASAAHTLLLDASWASFASEPTENLHATCKSENLAYVIFTSGSTGRPKGAMNEHGAVCNLLLWLCREYSLSADDRMLQKTPFSFDVSVLEFFCPLIAGSRMVLASPDGHRDSAYLARLIRDAGITTLHFVPSMLQVFMEGHGFEECAALKRVFCGGEALPSDLMERFFSRFPNLELHNHYGPTEAAVDATFWACKPGRQAPCVPIGRPLANTRTYILDALDQPVPIGVAGELHIGGVQVGRGYLNRPELTAERFVVDPFSADAGARLYRTGDLARYLSDGNIEFLGRTDHQVKLRGFRIELGEIEALLMRQPQLREAVVLLREDTPGDPRLVAYVVPVGEMPNTAELREALKEQLPDHMIPAAFVPLAALPLTASGKADRKALEAPNRGQTAPLSTSVAGREPPSTVEDALARIWRELLRHEAIGIHENFFDLGGHSLLAIRLVSRVRDVLGIELPVRALFDAPTIAGLALQLDATRNGVPAPPEMGTSVPVQRPSQTARPDRGANFVEPRNALETLISDIWRDVLNLEAVGMNDNFFELGGHSLLAMRVTARIQSALNVEVAVRTLFEATTVERLCAAIARDHTGLQVPQQPMASVDTPGPGHESRLQPDPAAAPADAAAAGTAARSAPLSCAQEGLWFLDGLAGPSGVYNIAQAMRLTGPLNLAALERSVHALVHRHESLRTAFLSSDGVAMQSVRALEEVTGSLQLVAMALEGQTLAGALQSAAAQPFDLALAPLLRVRLWRTGEHEHALLLVVHHIVADGWSMGILARELGALYGAYCTGQPDGLAPLPRQFADYSVWQRERLNGPSDTRDLAYWRKQLAGIEPLQLHTDRARAPRSNHQGARKHVEISPNTLAELKALARRENATLFMVLLAAFQVLLMRHSGQHDVAVGSPVAGRHRTEFEGLIGYFVNTLVIRSDLSGNPSFVALLARVRQTCLQAYEHQEQPFDKLVSELSPQRDLGRNPLYQVVFVLQNTPPGTLELGNLRSEPLAVDNASSKFDLSLSLGEEGDCLRGTLEYSTQLFDAATIERLVLHFGTLLDAIVAQPAQPIERLPLMNRLELELLSGWSGSANSDPLQPNLHQLFEAKAWCQPDAVAVTMGDTSLSYAELNARANRLAHQLRCLGVERGVLVGVCMQRSPDLIVALVATLKAGGAYVPLDLEYPSERLAFMLADTAAPVLITEQALLAQLPAGNARVLCIDRDAQDFAPHLGTNLLPLATADDLAYVIYTSGSTGTPKGVMVQHHAVARLVIDTDYVQLGPDDVVAQASNSSFDAATFEIWGALLNGAKLVIVAKEVLLSGPALAREITAHQINTLFLTTSLFKEHASNSPGMFGALKQLLFGGESIDPTALRRVLDTAAPARLLNVYGPTETTTFATWFEAPLTSAELGARVPIGRPIANTRCWVLDVQLEPVPVGVVGELYVGGPGLARGYLNRPELTAERFIDDPSLPGERLYRTGDLVRYLPDGNLDCLGRADRQVKLRGFRIELGEIEAALVACTGVHQAVVQLSKDSSGAGRLVAYVVSPDGLVDTALLVAELKKRLPAYMIPFAIVALRALPLTPNGKLDHKALPQPGFEPDPIECTQHTSDSQAGDTPVSPLEHRLSAIWCDVFGVDTIGVQDDFFELGGHSLLAIRLLTRIDQALGTLLTVSALFQAPSIRQLAAVIEQQIATPNSCVVSLQPMGEHKAVFAIAGYGGGVMPFRAVARELGLNRPLCVLDTGVFGLTGEDFTLEELARRMIMDMRQWQPEGPYHLAGYSLGGNIAFEMARQLRGAGVEVGLLALLDSGVRGFIKQAPFLVRTWLHVRHGLALRPLQASRYLAERVSRLRKYFAPEERPLFADNAEASTSPALAMQRSANAVGRAWERYEPSLYPGSVLLIRAEVRAAYPGLIDDDPEMGWGALVGGGVQLESMQCAHLEVLKPENAAVLGSILVKHLARVELAPPRTCEPLGSDA